MLINTAIIILDSSLQMPDFFQAPAEFLSGF